MDREERYFWLAVSVVASSVLVFILAGFLGTVVPTGFWAVMGSVVTLITASIARGDRR